MKKILLWILAMIVSVGPVFAEEQEVLQEGVAKVFVREHPQTGKAFVSLRREGATQDLFKGFVKREIRPDYKMLDAKTRSGDAPYDGPVSDRKKVYIFAATMMKSATPPIISPPNRLLFPAAIESAKPYSLKLPNPL